MTMTIELTVLASIVSALRKNKKQKTKKADEPKPK